VTGIPATAPPDPAAPPVRPFASRRLAWAKTPGMNLSDREFLAPALEILETPPSPVHVAFLWIICAFVAAALAWAYFGRVDIIAAAQGKFQPTGQVKVVEPLETGRVENIRVGNGSFVQAGDVLVELDRSAAEADTKGARGARFRAGGNPAPQDRAHERAIASLRFAPSDRLAGERGAELA